MSLHGEPSGLIESFTGASCERPSGSVANRGHGHGLCMAIGELKDVRQAGNVHNAGVCHLSCMHPPQKHAL